MTTESTQSDSANANGAAAPNASASDSPPATGSDKSTSSQTKTATGTSSTSSDSTQTPQPQSDSATSNDGSSDASSIDDSDPARALVAAREKIAQLQSDLQKANKESKERRKIIDALSPIEEKNVEAEKLIETLKAELEQLRGRVKEIDDAEAAEKAGMLKRMTADDQRTFGQLGLAELKPVFARLYGTKPTETSQGDQKPPTEKPEPPLETQLEAAVEAGDKSKINQLMDKVLQRDRGVRK